MSILDRIVGKEKSKANEKLLAKNNFRIRIAGNFAYEYQSVDRGDYIDIIYKKSNKFAVIIHSELYGEISIAENIMRTDLSEIVLNTFDASNTRSIISLKHSIIDTAKILEENPEELYYSLNVKIAGKRLSTKVLKRGIKPAEFSKFVIAISEWGASADYNESDLLLGCLLSQEDFFKETGIMNDQELLIQFKDCYHLSYLEFLKNLGQNRK